MSRDDLTFGWFLPTSGDTTCLGDPVCAESGGLRRDRGSRRQRRFQISPHAGERDMLGSDRGRVLLCGRTECRAADRVRSGRCNPTLAAKMFATLDQMSGGRLCINLIAGISDDDTRADGILDTKEVRYEKMDEEVEIMKKLWAAPGAIDHQGKHYTVTQAIEPKPLQQPFPPFFLGGGSDYALEISAKHSTVHLFWGDKPAVIAEKIEDIRERAAKYGRRDEIQFGMRLQIICRDTEEAAWEEAYRLIAGSTKFNLANNRLGANAVEGIRKTSEANRRVWDLLRNPARR